MNIKGVIEQTKELHASVMLRGSSELRITSSKPFTALHMIKLFKCQPGGAAMQLQVLAHLPPDQTLLRWGWTTEAMF